MTRTNVAIVTGTRAEYGIWRPVIAAVEASKKLRLQLVVTGMHLQKQFGMTVKDIASPIAAKVPMYKTGDSPAQSLARGIAGMAAAFAKLKPQLVMVLGDRLEILAAASAALACQIPIAHVHGGETAPAQWDEQIRHAVTKMAHLHFCATPKSAERIRQMGEDPSTIHLVGAPALDLAVKSAQDRIDRMRPFGKLEPLLVLHPSSPDDQVEYRRTKMLVKLIRKVSPHTHYTRLGAIGPNNDPGHRGILRAYKELAGEVALDMSMPQEVFWGMMQGSGLLIGNSSSGIIEAASFGCIAINIGNRQAGRERSPNVIDVPWNPTAIAAAIDRAHNDKDLMHTVVRRQNVYGDGHASERIVNILENLTFPLTPTKAFHNG